MAFKLHPSEYFRATYWRKYFTEGHERTLRAKKNVTISFVCKFVSILISFLIVPLTLGYIGKVEYGIWMTLSSIIQWFAFFDVGLGNGLRNKLAEAIAMEDQTRAKIYISSSFALISGIAVTLFILFVIASTFISWNMVLNTNILPNEELLKIVTVVFLFFCVGFILGIISSILQAMQLYAINDILGLIAQIFGLVAVYMLVTFTDGSLFLLCLVFSSKTVIVIGIATVILFSRSLKIYRPSIKFVKIKDALPLINLGLKFFVNQILYMIVTQTSVFLIVQFFGPEEVTVYNLSYRYMTIVSMGYIMVLTPFLSAFTDAYTKKEFNWIKMTMRKLNKIMIVSFFATFCLVLGYEKFFELWVGDKVEIPFLLILSLGVSTVIGIWSGTYGLFLNGVGKLNIQLYLMISQAVLFFPLSYMFYRIELGVVSIVLPQILFSIVSVLVMGIQYKKIVSQTATGIWAR